MIGALIAGMLIACGLGLAMLAAVGGITASASPETACGPQRTVGATEYGGPGDPSSGSVGGSGVSLIAQPARSLLKRWGHGAADLGAFSMWVGLIWALKPFSGLLTDFVPLFGYRRKSYLVIANIAAVEPRLIYAPGPRETIEGVAATRSLTRRATSSSDATPRRSISSCVAPSPSRWPCASISPGMAKAPGRSIRRVDGPRNRSTSAALRRSAK